MNSTGMNSAEMNSARMNSATGSSMSVGTYTFRGMSDEQYRDEQYPDEQCQPGHLCRSGHMPSEVRRDEQCRVNSTWMNSTWMNSAGRVNSTASHTWVSHENPPTLGTRGYIPDTSPRGYVGLGESCIVLPKIGIAELVLKI